MRVFTAHDRGGPYAYRSPLARISSSHRHANLFTCPMGLEGTPAGSLSE
jgi:hypothetical protein